MSIVHFITHPEVVIDPTVPVPLWPLAPEGIRRMTLASGRSWMSQVGSVFSSAERKATDAARLVASRFGLSPVVVAGLGENDRSATGYLPKMEFEATADAFFSRPTESIRGWERAIDAQRRIVEATELAISSAPPTGDVAVISHGGVGALLLCHLKRVPINRSEDQPDGRGGFVYSFDRNTRTLLSDWRQIEFDQTCTVQF